MSPDDVVRALLEAVPQVFSARAGDRVSITLEDVTATGTIGEIPRGLFDDQSRIALEAFPVILDGTGQEVEIPARLLTRMGPGRPVVLDT